MNNLSGKIEATYFSMKRSMTNREYDPRPPL